jgi:hypothetical protein
MVKKMSPLENTPPLQSNEYCPKPNKEDPYTKLLGINSWYQQFMERPEIKEEQCKAKE